MRKVCSSSVSSSASVTVAPNLMTEPDSFETSMTSARATLSSSSIRRPSIKLWRSRAAWYSAFSDRSPWVRASAMARITAGRSTDFRRLISSCRWLYPSVVIGILFIRPCSAFYPDRRSQVGLQRSDFKATLAQRSNRLYRRAHPRDRRVVRNIVRQRGAAQAETVGDRLCALGGIEDELNAPAAHL